MSYTEKNFKTKKALKNALAAGDNVYVQPEMNGKRPEGTVYLKGPHFPEPHRWYAQVQVADGKVVKILG